MNWCVRTHGISVPTPVRMSPSYVCACISLHVPELREYFLRTLDRYIAASSESRMVGKLLPRPSPGQPGGYAKDLSANQNQESHVLVHRELVDHSDEAHEPGVSYILYIEFTYG